MYAVIVTGGKQYRVEKGDVIFVEKLNAGSRERILFRHRACGWAKRAM